MERFGVVIPVRQQAHDRMLQAARAVKAAAAGLPTLQNQSAA
jgi:hypothetical protein